MTPPKLIEHGIEPGHVMFRSKSLHLAMQYTQALPDTAYASMRPEMPNHQSYQVKNSRLQRLLCLFKFPGTPRVHPPFQETSSQDFTRVVLTSQRYRVRTPVNKANMIATPQMTSQRESAGSRHPKSTTAHDVYHSFHRVHLPQRVGYVICQAFPGVFIAECATTFCRERTAQSALVRNWREGKVTCGSNERGRFVFIS
jgi:hypothetical protein